MWGNDGIRGKRVETAKLTAFNGHAGDGFGNSVAVDGETIVIGAPGYNANTGVAYVFTRNSMTRVWGNDPESGETHRVETAKLTAFNGHAGDGFGNSVAVDGETIVIGAPGYNANTGVAYVFTRNSMTRVWGNDPESGGNPQGRDGAHRFSGDGFGNSVAVDGETIVIVAGANTGVAMSSPGIRSCVGQRSGIRGNPQGRDGQAHRFQWPRRRWVRELRCGGR